MSNNSKSQDILEDILLIQTIKDGKLTHCPKCSAQITTATRNDEGKMVLVCRDYTPEMELLNEVEGKLDDSEILIAKYAEERKLHEKREFLLENVLLHFCNELGFNYGELVNDLDTTGGKYKIEDREIIRKNIINRCIEIASKFQRKET